MTNFIDTASTSFTKPGWRQSLLDLSYHVIMIQVYLKPINRNQLSLQQVTLEPNFGIITVLVQDEFWSAFDLKKKVNRIPYKAARFC